MMWGESRWTHRRAGGLWAQQISLVWQNISTLFIIFSKTKDIFNLIPFFASLLEHWLWFDNTDKSHIWSVLQEVIIQPIVMHPTEYITLQVHNWNVVNLFCHCFLCFPLLSQLSQLLFYYVCLYFAVGSKNQLKPVLKSNFTQTNNRCPGCLVSSCSFYTYQSVVTSIAVHT